MITTPLEAVGDYADRSATEIWEGITSLHTTWEDATEFFELYSDRLEAASWSPFHDIPPEIMYDLIEVRLLRLEQGRGPGKGI